MYYYSVISLYKLYIYSIFVYNFHMIENVSPVYLIVIKINLECSIIGVVNSPFLISSPLNENLVSDNFSKIVFLYFYVPVFISHHDIV